MRSGSWRFRMLVKSQSPDLTRSHNLGKLGRFRQAQPGSNHAGRYSHSMVPGGFDVTSSTTRLTPSTSLVMRLEMRASTS